MAKESDTVNGISNLSTWDAKVMNLRPIRVLLVAGQHGLQSEFLTQEKSQKGRQSVGGGGMKWLKTGNLALLTSGCAYSKLLHSRFSGCALSIMRMEVKCVTRWAGHGHHLPRITHTVQTNKWLITGSRKGCHPINLSGFIATSKTISEKPGQQPHERKHTKSRVQLSHLHHEEVDT